jgi:glycerol uptake facilitator-like aquaporin
MVKSGLIFGAISVILILASATLLTPLCAPCLGLFLGILAGYAAGIFDKPTSSREAIRKGGIAGVITGSLALVGSLLASIINGAIINPSSLEAFYRNLGINNLPIDPTTIWIGQIAGGCCIGLFNVFWMGILGVAGGALWFQISGKNQPGSMLPPQDPTPPDY